MTLPALLALLVAAPPTLEAPPAPPAPPAAPAKAVAPRPPAPAKPPAARHRRGEWPERPSGKRVTIGEKLSIDDALEKIAESAGWSLVANTGRIGEKTLVVNLSDVAVEDALEAVLEGTPLVATRRGASVTVAPSDSLPQAEVPVLAGFDTPTGKSFTGDFDNDGIDEALQKVTEAAGLSVVLPPGLHGAVTAHFKAAPVEDVLRVLLSQAGLTAVRQGSIVTVSRSGGEQVVIRGGKRRVSLRGLPSHVEIDVGKIVQDAERAAENAGAAVKGNHRNRQDKVISGDYVLKPGERAQEVVVLRGNVRMEPGSTADQVTAIGGSVELGPGVSVEREVVAVLGDVHVGPSAHVGGDTVSIGGKVIIDEGAEVEGQQVSIDIPGIGSLLSSLGAARPRAPRHPGMRLLTVLAEFAVFFVLGLLILMTVPRRLDTVATALGNAPLMTVLAGLIGTIAMPVLTLLLIVTVIGIPLVVVQVVGVVVAGVLGFSALAMFVGRATAARVSRGGQVLKLAIGTALMVAVGKIPVLGTLVWITAWLFVFGAVIRTRFGQSPSAPIDTTVAAPPPAPAT